MLQQLYPHVSPFLSLLFLPPLIIIFSTYIRMFSLSPLFLIIVPLIPIAYFSSHLISLLFGSSFINFEFFVLNLPVFLTSFYIFHFYFRYFTRPNPLPGPFPIPFLTSRDYYSKDLISWAMECYNCYGDIWEVYTELSRDIWISRGDLMVDVMLGNRYKQRFPTANYAYMKLGPGDKGLGFNNRLDNWERTRDVVDSVMKSKGFLDEVVKWTEEYYRIIEKEKEGAIDEMHDYKQLVERVAVKVFTGDDLIESGQMLYNLDRWINERGYITNIKDIIIELWQSLTNGNLNQRTYEGLPDMHSLAQKVLGRWDAIRSCPAERPVSNDLLTKLRVANTVLDRDKKSTVNDVRRPFSPSEITAILTEMLVGGIYKTLPVLKNLVAALEKNPSLLTPLIEELTATFGDTLPVNLTADSLSSLPYCDALISETIRLNTPVPIITRTAAQPVNLRAKAWPTGTTVKLVVNGLSMNQRNWKNPEKFNPERFLELKSAAERNRKEIMSFGNGPRACPGREMIMCLLKTFLVLRFWDSQNKIVRDVKGVRDVDALNFSWLY